MDPIATERKTVHAMIAIYCQAHHGGAPLCESCAELEAYVDQRLEKCPFGWEKPTCKNCKAHHLSDPTPAQRGKVLSDSIIK